MALAAVAQDTIDFCRELLMESNIPEDDSIEALLYHNLTEASRFLDNALDAAGRKE
jgi:hypothetical protein